MRKKIVEIAGRLKQYRQEKPFLGWPLQIGGGLLISGFLGLLTLVLLVRIGAFGALPNEAVLQDIQNDTASEVYSSDGEVLGKYFRQNRTNVGYDEISPFILDALVATEDARFFEHKGIDLRSWVRVFVKTVLLRDDSGGGGSTLSQQLAKNLYPRNRGGLLRIPVAKIKEMFIARRLERVYSKDELLNVYLNTVPFGSDIFGVEVAARTFFNTTAKDIKIEDAAVLVGMLKANTYYNPVRNPESATGRRNVVLRQMQKLEKISATDLDSLQALELQVDYHRESNHEGLATYFREHLRQKLQDLVQEYAKPDGTPYNLYTDGLKIYTTIDSRLQNYAEEAVHLHLKKLQKDFDAHWKGKKPWGDDEAITRQLKKTERYQNMLKEGHTEAEIMQAFNTPEKMTVFSYDGDVVKEMTPLDSLRYYYCLLNAGFMAMEPSTGKVMAWVGGIDHKYFQYDHIKSRRQVGSTFKPIVYANALRQGVAPCDYIHNRLVIYTEYEDWQPENSDGQYQGLYSMEGGLSHSVNSIAVNLIMRTGIDSVRELAHRMGISSDIPEVPAIALGAVDVALYDMMQVYGTIANRGVKVAPQYLLRIENNKGELIAEFKPEHQAQRVLSNDQADMMVHMMEAVVDSGTARRLRYAYKFQGDIAGKTGTTQSHADGWFMGFTPKLVAGSWVGGEYPQVHFRSISLGQGANTALPIWAEFMKRVNQDKDRRRYVQAIFPTPSEAVLEALNCEPYIEEEPVLVEDESPGFFSPESDFFQKFDDLLGSFKKNKKKETDRVNAPPENSQREEQLEAQRKESERIRKKNERLEKKRERQRKRGN